jgi:SAM-dependent methyltransferase
MFPPEDRTGRRLMFDQVAELYDRARPGYPPELHSDLVELAGLGPGSRVLEIGCGTGQATIPLAERGLGIVCVELGEALAAVARRRLARYPNVRVVTADFEDWEPERAGFDAVVAFTAFHWLDPALRFEKTARLLGPDGALGVVATQHVLPPGGDSFFVDVQEDYDAVAPDPENRSPPPPEAVGDVSREFTAGGRFREVAVRRYVWDVEYDADAYIDVLDTYSGHRAMDPATRERLSRRIRHRIEAQPGGRIRKSYLALLHVARRST